jgi:transposase
MVNINYVGVDVSNEELVCAYPTDQGTFEERRMMNNEEGITAFIGSLNSSIHHVITEATGTYSMRLVWALCQAGIKVSVLTPSQSWGFISSVLGETIKNDSRDARNLSIYGQKMNPPIYTPHPEAVQKANQLQKLYSQLVVDKGAVSNRLHALSYHPCPDETVLSVQKEMLNFYEQKIEQVKAQMTNLDQEGFDKMVDLIASITGIGPVTATAIVVITNGLGTFQSHNQLAKFVGVNPTQQDSGKTIRGKGQIPKKGNRRLRALLYVCAKSAKRFNPKSKELYERLRAKGKCHKVAMIAITRQLIRYIFAVVKNDVKFDKNYVFEPAKP